MIRDAETENRASTLSTAAERAWVLALADFYHPPLPDIEIEHDENASSFFYIDSSTWTVHLNTVGVPLNMDMNEAEPYLRSVCHHEIQHYLSCPYDGVTAGMMFAAARRHVNDPTAMFVCNLFADLVVDTGLLKRFPNLSYDRINASIHDSALRINDHSDLWKLIVSCYRAMWGFPIPPRLKIEEKTYEAALEIIDVTRKHIDHMIRWPKATAKIAQIIADWAPEPDEPLAGCGVPGGSDEDDSNEPLTIPVDVDGMMGDPLEPRNRSSVDRCMNRDRSDDIEADIERLANEVEQRGGTLEDLEGVLILAGIGNKRKEWIRFWYRAKARTSLRIDMTLPKQRGSTPLTSMVWRLGDPMEELDIVQSLQAFPVLVPNMSTRRWMKQEHFGPQQSSSLPDLLVVIDSSGSMTWSMSRKRVAGPYHTALVSAFAAVELALQKGSSVGVINFSDGHRKSEWTRDRTSIERVLLAYQGGGTVAPVNHIVGMCSENSEKVLILMITDAEVANWDDLVDGVFRLTKRGHKFLMFHIGGQSDTSRDPVAKHLRKAGAVVIPISSASDLEVLVIREVRGVYR
ncbi:MAG: VWA domain-containing protein [Candidatus Thorarchaeota archaeon]